MLPSQTLRLLVPSFLAWQASAEAEPQENYFVAVAARATQTQGSPECSTAFEALITDLPKPPSDFISFWSENNPASKSCLAEVPASLTKEFSSVYSEYSAWGASNSAAFASIASKCPQYNFGGSGQGKRDSPDFTLPSGGDFSIPPEWASWATQDWASALPSDFNAFGSFPPCPTTPGNVASTPATPTSGNTTPTATGSNSTVSASASATGAISGGVSQFSLSFGSLLAFGAVGAAIIA